MQTWKLTKTLVKVGQNQLFLENKMAITFDFKHEAKKLVATRCKVMAKNISIYFDTIYETLMTTS